MKFKSEYEAHTHLLIKQKEIEEEMANISMQMNFLFMNIRRGNFLNEKEKKHAMKELSYLINASGRLTDRAGELNALSLHLYNHLSEQETEKGGETSESTWKKSGC